MHLDVKAISMEFLPILMLISAGLEISCTRFYTIENLQCNTIYKRIKDKSVFV